MLYEQVDNAQREEQEILHLLNEQLRLIHIEMEQEVNMIRLANLYYKASMLLKAAAEAISLLKRA